MDPVTLAAVTGGFAAVKSAISGVRSALESADDVSAIASHIDTLFKTHGAAKKRIKEAQNKKPTPAWQKLIKFRLGEDNDETSLANITAAKLAEKQQEEDIRRLSIQINKRFGANTWDEILEAQKEAGYESAGEKLAIEIHKGTKPRMMQAIKSINEKRNNGV